MSDPALGIVMLSLIIVVIMLGFPTAFTLMGLGMFFGFVAFYDPSQSWTQNRIFDLMVQRTYGAMTNDTLLSIPLFVLMGYVMERGALVDKMFYAVQLAFRGLPASLAVATLIICTFWGIASGLVGAVVVLMGVIAFNPMLKAGYDTRLAAGVITAGGTLGILIPPSVMIIVYAAIAGQSVVKLYAAAIFPGFFLAFLYLVYVIGWALINPKIAPKLPESETRAPIPEWVPHMQAAYSPNMGITMISAVVRPNAALKIAIEGKPFTYWLIVKNAFSAVFPLLIAIVTMGGLWWYMVIHQQAGTADTKRVAALVNAQTATTTAFVGGELAAPLGTTAAEEKVQELGGGSSDSTTMESRSTDSLQSMGTPEFSNAMGAPPSASGPPDGFYLYFWLAVVAVALVVGYYYSILKAEQFVILKLLIESVMPLGLLTILVLGVILLGICTATESAGIGAAGAFLLALHSGSLNLDRTRQSLFLTAKTTSMVCWLFVGSALFSAVFAILGGQQLVEKWVLALGMTPLQFMLLSQAIIFILGWPLEWTEIIVIFVPIFLPMLKHYGIDPILWGTLVFVNLQAAFLSPPVAMSAFYLKGVAPPHVTLNQIFAGMMPYMFIVILCMVLMYTWPGMTLWLPNYLYGGG